jgi:hypothetical protein
MQVERGFEPNMEFRMHESGLHYYDPRNDEFIFVTTVSGNKKGFTQRQITGAATEDGYERAATEDGCKQRAANEVGHEAANEVGHEEAANDDGSEVATEDGSEVATEDDSEVATEDGSETATEDGSEAANEDGVTRPQTTHMM